MKSEIPCEILPWDTEFFGHRIGRVRGHRLDRRRAEAIEEWCRGHAIECVYLLADPDDPETSRLAEDSGFHLMDVRVRLGLRTADMRIKIDSDSAEPLHIRPSRPADIPSLQAIARKSYHASRFYFDPCFPQEACEALYEKWIGKSCRGYADVVMIAEENEQPVGYISCHLDQEMAPARIGLLGVAARAQGLGVGQGLVRHALHWFAEREAESVSVVTQGRNVAAQRLYQRCGFLTESVHLWYHKWMPDCEPKEHQ